MHFKTVNMSDKRYDTIYSRIQQSYPNACVLYIDEVVNEYLLNYYTELRERLQKVTKIEEKQLFHGTSDSLINVIAVDGFDPTKNKSAAYGYGTYFAKNANYSFNYMRSEKGNDITYMFLADVLVGRMTIGKGRNPNDIYDWENNVDNFVRPTIFTTPYHNGAYPRYIIAFHKNAK
jgi:hypothetical protein